jgi:predicted transcriptional regulator
MADRILLETLIYRLTEWPKPALEELFRAMDEIEIRHDLTYKLSDEERADLEAAVAEADRGEFVPDEEVKALFDRFRIHK